MIRAAGLLVYKKLGTSCAVLLMHPGGPFWEKKDDWSIPKGEVDAGETLLQTLEREFIEEVGIEPPLDNLFDLGSAPVNAAKTNYIWAAEGDIDISQFHCDSMVTMPWPPKSDSIVTFPENDRAEWFDLDVAYRKIYKSQMIFIERLAERLGIQLDKSLV